MTAGSILIGVLVCDHVADELREAADGRDYAKLYDDFLRRADPSVRTRAYHVVDGEFPVDPAECDAWVLTGARHDAFGDEPWVVELRAFVRRSAEGGSRVVGICFGHQVIAQALGGRVERAAEWKAGPQATKLSATPWFGGGSLHLHAMHRDVVTELPGGAVPIAEGETAEYPAYLVGESIFCVQDHPEFTDGYVAALIDARRGRMGTAVAEAAEERVGRVPCEGDVVGRWIVDFLADRRLDPATTGAS